MERKEVTLEEFKKHVNFALTRLANKVAEIAVYEDWDDAFSRKKIKEAFLEASEDVKKYINWFHLTEEQCRCLGFLLWDSKTNIYLIPLWLYPIIPVGLELYCINGDKIEFDGHNIDEDTRFGCLAYGIKPKE